MLSRVYFPSFIRNYTTHKARRPLRSPGSVTGTVFPAVPPPLVHTRAVELGLPQPHVDVVMDTAEPLREGMAAPGVWLIAF